MSETLAGKHRSDEIRKIMTTSVLVAAIGDPAIHGAWLPLGQFSELLHAKHPNGESIKFETKECVRHLNKWFPHQSVKANEVQISVGKKVSIFQHELPKGKSRCRFLYMTDSTVTTFPKLPTKGISLEWDENCILRKPWKRCLAEKWIMSYSYRILGGGWSRNDVIPKEEVRNHRGEKQCTAAST
jgi:hypothetical protein